jgi:hypothetical protein
MFFFGITNTVTMRNIEVCLTDLMYSHSVLKYKPSLKECGKDDTNIHSVHC